MSKDIQSQTAIAYSKLLYEKVRKTTKGCPYMIAIKNPFGVNPNTYFVEAKDGSILLENVRAANIWEAKYIGACEWRDKNKTQ